MNERKIFNSYVTEALDGIRAKMGAMEERKNEIAAANRRMNTFNEYVCLFIVNLNRIIKHYNLRIQDLRVLLQVLEYMHFGNAISISVTAIAEDTGMDKGNVSRAIKRMKEIGLIVEDRGSLYFNAHIAFKGFFDENDEDNCRLLEASAEALEKRQSPATPSIDTKNIRRKLREAK